MEGTRHKILFIEDDKMDQMAFTRAVQEQDLPYDCTIAGSVSKAKSILDTEQFDIVIADYALGDGTALDVLDSVKNTPVVIVTGTGNEEVAVKAWKAGAYDYLIKDLDRNYLKAVPITVANVIEHKRVEGKLHLLSGAIMSTDDSVYITDMEDKIIFINRAFVDTYGYKEEEIIGQYSNILWITKPQSDKTRSVFQSRTVGSTWEVGFYHRRKNGSVFPVSLSRSIIKDPRGTDIAIVAVSHDISERILVEDELRTENLRLGRQNQLKSEMAVIIAEALKVSFEKKDIERAQKLIDDFLDISRIETGKISLKLSGFDIRDVVSEVVQAKSPLASEKNIKLESFIPESQLIINADRSRIKKVLDSLVNNAMRSVSSGGHINVLVKENDNRIRLEVQDDGPPVDSSEVHKLFNHFIVIKEHLHKQHEQLAGPASSDGTNEAPPPDSCDLLLQTLSLPIAKVLIDLHGGRLWFENKQDKQNCFCFTMQKEASVNVPPANVK
jgi:PAS domain S-box-containing protein